MIQEDNIEEVMQQKAKLVEERTLSGTLDTGNATEVSLLDGENGSGGAEVAEKKNETVEGEDTTLVDTTRDVDVEGLKPTDSM